MTTELSKHDMLPRLAENEPGFVLAARDARAEWFVRLYAAARRHDLVVMDDIYNNLRRECMKEPVRPTDSEHAISAANRANDMYLWRRNSNPMPPGTREYFTPVSDTPSENVVHLYEPRHPEETFAGFVETPIRTTIYMDDGTVREVHHQEVCGELQDGA